MGRELNKTRAALLRNWSDHVWSKRDQKRCRFLTARNEAQRHAVMWSLQGHRDDLVARMQACGEVDEHDNMRRCHVPLCPRCLMLRRGAETKKVIREEFAGIPNDGLALLTVLMPVDVDLAAMTGIMTRGETRLRNFVVRHRNEDPRWNDVHLVGYWELDRLRADEIADQGRNTRLFLSQCGVPVTAGDATLWLPHFHAIVALGDVPREEFAALLRGYGYNAAYQVDVQEFKKHRDVEDNLESVVRYANKFRVEHGYKGAPVFEDAEEEEEEEEEPILFKRNWWPQADIRAYAAWLCGEHSGFQSMRLRIKPSTDASEPVSDEASDVDVSGVVAGALEGSVEECVRYKNLVQDTNWLPTSKPKRRKPDVTNDDFQPVHHLFQFAEPKLSASSCAGKGLSGAWRQALGMPRSVPQPIASDRLRQMLQNMLQRRV